MKKQNDIKRFSVIECKFTENKNPCGEPVSHTENGKLIFIHAGHKGKVIAGQAWTCTVVTIRDNYIIIVPETLLSEDKPEQQEKKKSFFDKLLNR